MAASRLDVEWDRGADWSLILARRTRNGVVVPAQDPCRWEVRAVDAPSSTPALLTLAGTVRDDGRVKFDAGHAEIDGLPGSSYEYRVVWTDGAGPRLVLVRGYIAIEDNAGRAG